MILGYVTYFIQKILVSIKDRKHSEATFTLLFVGHAERELKGHQVVVNLDKCVVGRTFARRHGNH